MFLIQHTIVLDAILLKKTYVMYKLMLINEVQLLFLSYKILWEN